ncbi:hypothetical protein ACT7DD_28110 [Bacillus paranthracis]
MNLMNTEWIEIEDLPRSEANESRKKALKGILNKLKTKYSTGGYLAEDAFRRKRTFQMG